MRISDWSSDVCSSDLSSASRINCLQAELNPFSLYREPGGHRPSSPGPDDRRMRLSTIKLSGFKSFVDPTTLHLPTNMTGVVGPNGCGKSNIIDAIRWVMGESAASRLRSEGPTSELQSLMRIPNAALCLNKQTRRTPHQHM